MSIEDVVLSTLLEGAQTVPEALRALVVYDEMQRPRTQRLVEASREAGYMMTGQGQETRLDPDLLQENLSSKWDFIHDFDMTKHRDEALAKLEGKLANGCRMNV